MEPDVCKKINRIRFENRTLVFNVTLFRFCKKNREKSDPAVGNSVFPQSSYNLKGAEISREFFFQFPENQKQTLVGREGSYIPGWPTGQKFETEIRTVFIRAR